MEENKFAVRFVRAAVRPGALLGNCPHCDHLLLTTEARLACTNCNKPIKWPEEATI